MHSKIYKLSLNTLMLIALLFLFVIPIGAISMAGIEQNPDVLAAEDSRRRIQKPRDQILLDNAKILDEEEDNRDYRP